MTTRWFVEVSRVDADTQKERYCVEALQWQQALQQARKLRGDRGALSQFAIELLESGYRATDPSARLRYTISKAPVSPALAVAAPSNGAGRSRAPVAKTAPPSVTASSPPSVTASLPPSVTASTAKAKPSAADGSAPPALTVPRRSASTIPTAPAVPKPKRSQRPPKVVARKPVPTEPPAATPTIELDKLDPLSAPLPEAVPQVKGLELVSMRKEEPTEAVPITYREYAFSLAEGESPEGLARLARAAWEQVRAGIVHRTSQKFVQIALFDHRFVGRPERPPVAVLAWKDWRGDPVIQIRAPAGRQGAAAPEGAAAPAALAERAPAAMAESAPATTGRVPPKPPAAAVPLAPSFPAPSTLEQAPAPIAQSQPAGNGQSEPSSSQAATARRSRRSEDLIGELFEKMHQLHFMPDIVAGAEYVLGILSHVMPSEGVLIHVFDINTRQFVVVRAVGPRSASVLLQRTPDTFPLFREAFRRTGTLAFADASGDEGFQGGRWEQLGVNVRAALCGAVQHGGRYLGVIELANPGGGSPFNDSEVNALDYICEQFADFVASRPIVLDDDAVIPRT